MLLSISSGVFSPGSTGSKLALIQGDDRASSRISSMFTTSGASQGSGMNFLTDCLSFFSICICTLYHAKRRVCSQASRVWYSLYLYSRSHRNSWASNKSAKYPGVVISKSASDKFKRAAILRMAAQFNFFLPGRCRLFLLPYRLQSCWQIAG